MATAVTSMRIPTELNERYSRLARETGRSRSFYVNEALQEAIDRFEYEYGILKEGFCYEFGSERIAGHEHRFCDILFFCRYVRSGNRHFVSSSNNKFGFVQIISVMRGLVKFCSRAAIKNPYRFRPSSA